MTNYTPLSEFLELIKVAIADRQLVKISLGNYVGSDAELKNVYVKMVEIKGVNKLSFNYRYKTRDIFKNVSDTDGLAIITDFLHENFKISTLFTTQEEVIIERDLKNSFRIRRMKLPQKKEVDFAHDKQKKRLILAKGNVYLHELGLTDSEGVVFKNAQDKYKQINQYIEILSSLIKELPAGTIRNVVDMGSGKGYLTFALYDYLLQQQQQAKIVGVEFRKDLVDLCNNIAEKSGFDGLSFIEGTIQHYQEKDINLLIALHACDTATDDAIYKGIINNAELIVVAPCCHKQIRREMEKGKAKNDLDFLTKHGIFLERQAEMVTDGLRALILEYFGYKTKVFEFVSGVHTPKNVLVVGIKANQKLEETSKAAILEKIRATKHYFGIRYHHLEKLLQL